MYQEFSAIYEAKIKEDFNYDEMADFMLRQLRGALIPMDDALDMGCGTGNASLSLVRHFRRMVLCDPSMDMLTLAREKFKNPYRPVFLHGHAAEFEMTGRFDLIFSVLDIPNYLDREELSAYVQHSWNNLKARGLMIFDLSSVLKLEEAARAGVYVYDDEDYFHVWENHKADQTLEMTLNVFTKVPPDGSGTGCDGYYKRITEEQIMYLHPAQMIEKTVTGVGFRIRGCYDGYTDQAAGRETRRLVYVLEKGETTNG